MSEIKALEHATLKVPYEILNKRFRSAQKIIDREVDQVMNVSRQVEKALDAQQPPILSDMTKLVANVEQKLQVLKRKADESINDELNVTQICKRKLEHLKGIIPRSNGDVCLGSVDQWKRIRLDRLVIEHLLRMGYYETAEELAARSDVRHLTNLDIFQTSREVEDDLANHSTTKCVLWCIDNKSKLRKINSTIEFSLRVQEFVELVRQNQRFEAVKHSRRYFPAYEKTQLNEICHVMALLAYPADTDIEHYKKYTDPKRWEQLVLDFRHENYRLFQLSNTSVFSAAVQAGLSALKTPQCYSQTCRNLNCPVCQEDLNRIALKLPYSHCVQSRLICRVTGKPLNEHNHPMMLPNGQIYGRSALQKITKEDGTITCPVTNVKFTKPKIDKVFIM
ncbi:E3 ubiquitin-protein transferase MAEA [Drosophila grimshawi]|uniref:E3 ubiquitin-protein transferase MAEA n=1 Tax=Drosophila grimshawi TaxID=7222 RepID=B4JRJ0_DROGR|nr:E3 ubiquitin-protein transferase MAEA [Drosophila grimshawi]EDV94380.1 GH20844 [Drosophila grimshawi]